MSTMRASFLRSFAVAGLAAALLCLGACAQTTRLTDQYYPPKAEGAPIEVFASRAPTRPYIEVALVSEASEWTSDRAALIESLKRQARTVGADAVILNGVGSSTSSGPGVAHTNAYTGVTTFTQSTSTVSYAEGIAVVWK